MVRVVRARWVQVLMLCQGGGAEGACMHPYGVHRLWVQACLMLPPRGNDVPHWHLWHLHTA